MDELKPILEELTREPIAFLGGFVSGLLKLSLNDDPIKTWIEKQGGTTVSSSSDSNNNNGNSGGPQSIQID
ncbi:hypothetical protein PA905_07740 [Planktothrix agardhii CCAP 1459/11A]|jgi:hypothetical protein|uniref:Uncharacterized protein n=1 Tax=Planktothrix agardhii CCAP 1459/11A TaxID=282420 RepID=A0A479ZTH5_PLAAG|nr:MULTISPECIES: hypothetical protein [Planktothrix]GCL34561.1 hypothetical protein PA905_07740 [Planktothrix agardhii CCAP 1459/11A]CAD5959671.1 UPF0426 protein [Planktothrix rubescens]CAH2575239.1 UPF0426 protein [Planktothrix rubescens]